MTSLRLAVVPLRILLVLTFAALVVVQLLVPGQLAWVAEFQADLDEVRVPLTIFVDTGLLCVQVVIACVWQLLGLVRDDRIFSERSLVWVDAIVASIAVAWLLMLGIFAYVLTWSTEPELPFAIGVMLLVGAVLGLLIVVMRTLLQQATTLRRDMEAVI